MELIKYLFQHFGHSGKTKTNIGIILTLSQLRLFCSSKHFFITQQSNLWGKEAPYILDLWLCLCKTKLKAHINAVHERKKPHKCLICDSQRKVTWLVILIQFMKDSIILILIVIVLILKRMPTIPESTYNMLYQFMRERNHLNVTFVTSVVL